MQFLAAGFLLIVIFALAIVYPPALACLSILAAQPETPMINVLFTEISRIPVVIIQALTFFAACSVFWRIKSAARGNPIYKRKLTITTAAFGISIWIGLSVFAATGSVYGGLSQLLSSGVYGIAFIMAYHRSRAAMMLILIPILMHLALGIGIALFPNSPMGLFSPFPTDLLDENYDYGISSDGIIRENGQFINSVPFAFYAAVAIVTGIFTLFYSRTSLLKTLGLIAVVIGSWVSYMTIQRAIWIGIAIAAFVILKPICKKQIGRLAYAAYFASLIFAIYLLYAYTDNPALNNLRSFFLSAGQDEYRAAAAVNSFDVIFRTPLFGMGGDVQQLLHETGGLPHQSPYSAAVLYGVPAGIGVLFLTWVCLPFRFLKKKIRKLSTEQSHSEIILATAIAWIVIAMALSNNMSAGMLGWICLGYGCLPWVYEVES